MLTTNFGLPRPLPLPLAHQTGAIPDWVTRTWANAPRGTDWWLEMLPLFMPRLTLRVLLMMLLRLLLLPPGMLLDMFYLAASTTSSSPR